MNNRNNESIHTSLSLHLRLYQKEVMSNQFEFTKSILKCEILVNRKKMNGLDTSNLIIPKKSLVH